MNDLLVSFVTEMDFFRAVAFIYALYSVYFTQIGFESSEEDSTLPVVSIPIDLGS